MGEKVLGFKENKIGNYVVGRNDCKLVPVVSVEWLEKICKKEEYFTRGAKVILVSDLLKAVCLQARKVKKNE